MPTIRTIALLAFVALLQPWLAPGAPAERPVYFFVIAKIDDHVNRAVSEQRFRHVLDLVEQFRAGPNPLTCTILISGSMAQALQRWNSQDGLYDRIRRLQGEHVVEIGYSGANEPTYVNRPFPSYAKGEDPEVRWKARLEGASRFLTSSRHPLTGTYSSEGVGGLAAVQELFGPAALVADLGGMRFGNDSEYVHHLRELSPSAILGGLPRREPARQFHGYRGSIAYAFKSLSPLENTLPELYIEDEYPRISESGESGLAVLNGDAGVDAALQTLGTLGRSKTHLVQIEIGRLEPYLSAEFALPANFPPLRLAYDHPDQPELPEHAIRPVSEIGAARQADRTMVEWVLAKFIPANPGSRFVSGTTLRRAVQGTQPASLTASEVRLIASDLVTKWEQNTYLPDWAEAGNRYYSLAEAFDLFCQVLIASRQPASVSTPSFSTGMVFGPMDMHDDAGPNEGSVTKAQIADAAATIWLNRQRHAVPSWVTVAGIRVNSAQFLRLMSQALAAGDVDGSLQIRLCNMFSSIGEMLPKNIVRSDLGPTWTIKPAPLRPLE